MVTSLFVHFQNLHNLQLAHVAAEQLENPVGVILVQLGAPLAVKAEAFAVN